MRKNKAEKQTGPGNASGENLEPIINAIPAAQICPKLLSDGSLVYDVQIMDGASLIEISAIDERRARECAEAINAAIREAIGNYV